MNAFFLILPLIIIRYFLLGLLNLESIKAAAHYPPSKGNEKYAYYVYQLTTIILVIAPIFLKVHFVGLLNYLGAAVYLLGVLLLIISTVNFALPKDVDLRTHGIYRFSRNPMYVGYFFYFLGCVLLTESLILLISLIAFQISAHWIILAEERWCQNKFGDQYRQYQVSVRRYI